MMNAIASQPADPAMSWMFREAASAPSLLVEQRAHNAAVLARFADAMHASPPQMVLTLGRGSSDNCASFARYLIERRLSLPTGSMAPSIGSVYGARLTINNGLLLAISQSGKSADLIAAARQAKASGARVVALLNDPSAPLAETADFVIDVAAGTERSVAATKSFILSITAVLDLLAVWGKDRKLAAQLALLPDLLADAWELDWSPAIEWLAPGHGMFVIARGHALSIAQEMALKLKETCGIQAEAISAAEVHHGPMAIVDESFPVFVLGQQDETLPGVEDLARSLIARGAQVIHTGLSVEGGLALPSLNADPIIAPILQLQSFYRMCEALSRHRGLDSDRPPFLNKVTSTL